MGKAAEISPMADNIRSNLTWAPFNFSSTSIWFSENDGFPGFSCFVFR